MNEDRGVSAKLSKDTLRGFSSNQMCKSPLSEMDGEVEIAVTKSSVNFLHFVITSLFIIKCNYLYITHCPKHEDKHLSSDKEAITRLQRGFGRPTAPGGQKSEVSGRNQEGGRCSQTMGSAA